jgi:hypothetical protein
LHILYLQARKEEEEYGKRSPKIKVSSGSGHDSASGKGRGKGRGFADREGSERVTKSASASSASNAASHSINREKALKTSNQNGDSRPKGEGRIYTREAISDAVDVDDDDDNDIGDDVVDDHCGDSGSYDLAGGDLSKNDEIINKRKRSKSSKYPISDFYTDTLFSLPIIYAEEGLEAPSPSDPNAMAHRKKCHEIAKGNQKGGKEECQAYSKRESKPGK